ncbi:hypothetical protein MTO96_000091 [Rhipicephalus appendiculatus]
MGTVTDNIPFAPQASSSSTQPEYPLVSSTPLVSWSLSGSECSGDQRQAVQGSSPAVVAKETVPLAEDETSHDEESSQQCEQLETGARSLESPVSTGIPSDAANTGATDTAPPTPLPAVSATSQPKKTLRLSYKDELRLAAKRTRNRTGTRNAAFEKAKAAWKLRRMRQRGPLLHNQRPHMFMLNRHEPSYADGLPQLSTLGASVREAATGSLNWIDLAESHRGWFHGRPKAGYRSDTVPTQSGGDSAVHDGVIHAVSRPTSSTLELLLYPLAFLLFVVLLVMLLMALPEKSTTSTPMKKIDPKGLVCTAEDCYQDAEYLSGLLSWEIDDPCDNFQPFVCRRWANTLKDSPLTQSVSSDDVYVSSVEQWVQAIYHKRPQRFGIPALLSDLTEKCRNTEHIENDGWSLLPRVHVQHVIGRFSSDASCSRKIERLDNSCLTAS